MKIALPVADFSGGWSTDLKQGTPNSFAYSKHLDFRKSPTQLTMLPAATKESASTVTDVITDMIQLPSGAMVAIDQAGGVYQRTTGGSWSKNGTTLPNTAAGMVYSRQHDTIYVPGLTAVHSITNADQVFGGSFTVNSSTFTAQTDQSSANGHAANYSTLGAISEAAANTMSFVPTIEPLYSIQVWVTTKGSGSLTVTMHDAANNVLGTSTLANGSITNGAYNEFVFSTPARMLAKPNPATYHFHATHPSGTAHVLGVSTINLFSTIDYKTLSNRLVDPVNNFHPMYEFLQYYLILNERYLAVWEPISQSAPSSTEFNQHKLTFPAGYEGTSGAIWTEYFAVACERRSTSSTNEFQDGKIFFWDGTSTTYNFIIDVPEGAPYGLFSHKNVLYYFAGGSWWAWSGNQPVKLFQMPNTDYEYNATNRYIINNPHTITVRNGILLGAFPSETNSTTIEHAVYSFGQRNKNYPNSFGYSYSISTGTNTNGTLRLGMAKSFGDKLFIAWRDGSNYGVDKVDPNSNPYTTASWESLLTDRLMFGGRSRMRYFPRPDKRKQFTAIKVTFLTLPTGATVTPKYKIDREASWNSGTGTAIGTAGQTSVIFPINKSYKEAQFGVDVAATTTSPTITAIVPITDSIGQEED